MTYILSVLIGSTRDGRRGEAIGKWIAEQCKNKGITVHLIDPLLYTDLQKVSTPHQYADTPSEQLQKVHSLLHESDGFIAITPEYNHSFSGAIKNMLDMFMPEYEKKPFGIVSYSASAFGGIRANEALRPVINELQAIATPTPLIISKAHETFVQGKLVDSAYEKRFAEFFEDFMWYVKALKAARN